jgi:hypothetical protein
LSDHVVRFIPSLPGYQYAVTGNTIYVNQYIAGKATIQLPDGEVTITQTTNYPWDGKVDCTITNKPKEGVKGTFKVILREPEWRGNTYAGSLTTEWNKTGENYTTTSKCVLGKDFKMFPRRIIAHPKVTANNGRVAIKRGPLVYCFEQVDNEVPVLKIKLACDPEFKEEFRQDLLGGIIVLKCKNADGRELTAIPYYARDHRQPGAMAVWVRQQGLSKSIPVETKNVLYTELKPEMLQPDSELENENETEISASFCFPNDSTNAAIDGAEPKNSSDLSIPRLTFWDHKGTSEWLELDFGTIKKISQCSVYWFDDTGKGGCRVPKSWTLSYRDGNQWKPVKTTETFGVEKDKYNTVKFDMVETRGLRMDIQLQDKMSGGVLEWKYTP